MPDFLSFEKPWDGIGGRARERERGGHYVKVFFSLTHLADKRANFNVFLGVICYIVSHF